MATRHVKSTYMLLVLLFCVVTGALCAPTTEPASYIVNSTREVNPDGSYSFSYLTSDGSYRQESGTLKYTKEQKPYIFVEGSFYYTDTEGDYYEVKYNSGLDGYSQTKAELFKSVVQSLPAGLLASLAGGGLG